MEELFYMIYILAFILGSILGLLLSYKKHMEPYIIAEIDIPSLILSIIGWIFVFNSNFFGFISSAIVLTIGFFLVGLVIGRRPGYGRKETIIGLIISIAMWFISQSLFGLI